MVAVASPELGCARQAGSPGRPERKWSAAAGAIVLLAVFVRLLIGGGGSGDRAAAVMTVLLGLGTFAAARVLGSPRTAFLVTLALMALLDLAAFPAHQATELDDRVALYRTDQTLAAQVAPSRDNPLASAVLTLLVEPVLSGSQPPFGIAAGVGDAELTWECPFRRGVQRLALPLPAQPGGVDVRLHLTGAPSRESDYLLVYTSSAHGGGAVALMPAGDQPLVDAQPETICTLR